MADGPDPAPDAEPPDAVVRALHEAYESGTPIDPLRDDHDLTLPEAYAVQRAVVERRRAAEGERAGYEVGFTSAAIRADVGVDEPAYGHLLRDTLRPEGALALDSLVEPKVEAELAFRLGESLAHPATTADVLAATDVADNALSGRVVLGSRARDPATLGADLALEGVQVRKNGERAATGVGADVLGHPANAVAWLAGALHDHDAQLDADDLVLTGSMTPLVSLAPGDTVAVRFGNVGSVTLGGR